MFLDKLKYSRYLYIMQIKKEEIVKNVKIIRIWKTTYVWYNVIYEKEKTYNEKEKNIYYTLLWNNSDSIVDYRYCTIHIFAN